MPTREVFLVRSRICSVRSTETGKPLSEQAAHLVTLSQIEVLFRGCLQLTFDLVAKLGEEECCPTQNSQVKF